MVVKSKGPRKRTREKFRGAKKFTVNRMVRQFPKGSKVAIVIDSSSQSGMPFRRFHGLTGTVLDKRGMSFVVEIRDGGKLKKIIAKPEHLKAL